MLTDTPRGFNGSWLNHIKQRFKCLQSSVMDREYFRLSMVCQRLVIKLSWNNPPRSINSLVLDSACFVRIIKQGYQLPSTIIRKQKNSLA